MVLATLDITFLFLDGANSMFGHISGLGVLIGKAFDYEIPVRHHCFSHRLELIIEAVMEMFPIFGHFDQLLKDIYSFYHLSHKRQNSLNEHCDEIGESRFRLAQIFEVRWISSQRLAIEKVMNHYYALVTHLIKVKNNARDFVQNTKAKIEQFVKKTERLIHFLTNKYAILLMHFNHDVVVAFSEESKYTQTKGSSLIGAGHRIGRFRRLMYRIQVKKGTVLNDFLSSCNCFATSKQANAFVKGTGNGRQCESLAMYEDSPFIVWKKIILKDTDLKHQPKPKKSKGKKGEAGSNQNANTTPAPEPQTIFTKISDMIYPYIDEMAKQIKETLPKDEVIAFDALDQKVWGKGIKPGVTTRRPKGPNVGPLAELFNMDKDLLQQQFKDLLKKIMANKVWWCKNRESEPNFFWSTVLNDMEPPPELSLLVRKALAIPLGSGMISACIQGVPFTISQN